MIEQIKQLLAQVSKGDKNQAALILGSFGFMKWEEVENLDKDSMKHLLRCLEKKHGNKYVERKVGSYITTVPNKHPRDYGVGDISFTFRGFKPR